MRVVACATAFLVACHYPGDPHVDDAKARVHVAQLEAQRAGGLDELIASAQHGDHLAIRALGRIGGDRARATLVELLAHGDNDAVAWAAAAIGVAASLEPERTPEQRIAMSKALEAALARTTHTAAVIEAIGRAGDPSSASVIEKALAGPPDVAAAAGIAIGRFGRRNLPWPAGGHVAIVAATRSPESSVRYAATYAFARGHMSFQLADRDRVNRAIGDALAKRIADPEPEIRALAIDALVRNDIVADQRDAIEAALADPDWRVAVEAVRARAKSDPDAVAVALLRHAALMAHDPREAQVIVEGLRVLAGKADHPAVAAALDALDNTEATGITRGWIDCLAKAARRDLPALRTCSLPDALRAGVIAEAIGAGAGTPEERRATLDAMLASKDPHVRASAFEPLAGLYDGDPDFVVATLAAAIANDDVFAASSAEEAADALVDKAPPLAQAIVARAGRETDEEFLAELLQAIGKHALDNAACKKPQRNPTVAAAARACLHDNTPLAPAVATPPPVDVTAVIGKRITWHLATTRGDVAIALRPDVAPWAVATLVSLTRAHEYDHIAFHRVVPDFVVQGGDPTETGAGGPGFTLPAEPGTILDGAGHITGGVGLADAGADSAGSQYFVMHDRAPHLDGRYTWVGQVVGGQKVADSLLIGDRVVTATVDVEP